MQLLRDFTFSKGQTTDGNKPYHHPGKVQSQFRGIIYEYPLESYA
jgi:hypothetical protein